MPVVNNDENRELLAERVVSEADLDDVVTMAINGCKDLYARDDEKFHLDWDEVYAERG